MQGQRIFIILILLNLVCTFSSVSNNSDNNPHFNSITGPKQFYKHAMNQKIVSDKVRGHYYHLMYGMFLLPLLAHKHSHRVSFKMLEIGLGCDMQHGVGASLALWRDLLKPSDKLWEAEYNEACITKYIAKYRADIPQNINFLVGDQSNNQTLLEWVDKVGKNNVDIIIDDGSHCNRHILYSFSILFEQALAPGGLYFIEDMQVGRHSSHQANPYSCSVEFKNDTPMIDIINGWNSQLMGDLWYKKFTRAIPRGIKWIFCQAEACVIAKCGVNDGAKCS